MNVHKNIQTNIAEQLSVVVLMLTSSQILILTCALTVAHMVHTPVFLESLIQRKVKRYFPFF